LERGKTDKGNGHKRYTNFPNEKKGKEKEKEEEDFGIFHVNTWLDFSFE